MIPNSLHRTGEGWGWPLLLMLVLLIAECSGEAGRAALRFDRPLIDAGQWWRLLSCSFVHLGWYHLMLNEIGLLVLVLLCPQPLSGLVWLRRLLLLSLLIGLCLYAFVPALDRYVGMSGVIHGLFVLGLLPQLRRGDWIAGACLVYLLGKLGYELATGDAVSDAAAIGGHVVTEAHLYGAGGAVVYGLVFGSFSSGEALRASSGSSTLTH